MLSVIPIPSWFLVLDNLLVDFISGFNLDSYQTWNLNCIHPNKADIISNYLLFYICNPSDDKVVNYSLSKFFIGKNTDWRFKGSSIALENMDDYNLENEKIITSGFIKCDELVLNFSNISEDLIRLSNNPIAKGYLI